MAATSSSTTIRMEQWAELAPLTSQERDSVSRLAGALSEAAAASLVYRPSLPSSSAADPTASAVPSTPALPPPPPPAASSSSSLGPESTSASAAAPAGTLLPSSSPSPTPTPATQPHLPDFTSWLHPMPTTSTTTQGRSLQASQTAAIEALHALLRSLEGQILDEHLVRANVNVAELRAGVRSVEETLEELGLPAHAATS
ncbi:hypothetical protein V8E36_002577 [Tilletia maclaganii]